MVNVVTYLHELEQKNYIYDLHFTFEEVRFNQAWRCTCSLMFNSNLGVSMDVPLEQSPRIYGGKKYTKQYAAKAMVDHLEYKGFDRVFFKRTPEERSFELEIEESSVDFSRSADLDMAPTRPPTTMTSEATTDDTSDSAPSDTEHSLSPTTEASSATSLTGDEEKMAPEATVEEAEEAEKVEQEAEEGAAEHAGEETAEVEDLLVFSDDED